MTSLRTPRALSLRLTRLTTLRTFATTPHIRGSWATSPAPPRLPKDEQERFERLQQQSTGAFSQPRTNTSATDTAPPTSTQRPAINQSPASAETTEQTLSARVEAKGDGEELHPHIRRGAPPEFDGETNPNTGEVGGPKNEPLRWGHGGDWSYNGRVTDF